MQIETPCAQAEDAAPPVPRAVTVAEDRHRGLSSAVMAVVLALAAAYIRLVGWTSSVRWYGRRHVPSGGFIYAFWHCRLLYFVYSHRGQGITVMVSKSKDGEYISSVIHRFGFLTVRGSSSRAGRESAIRMIRCLRQGKVCAITPDGPKGPAREVKEGIVYLARKTGRPVVPISCSLSRRKFLSSWDRFMVPLPFSRAVIVTGRPVYVASGEDAPSAAGRIRHAIELATRAADRLTEKRRSGITGRNNDRRNDQQREICCPGR